MKVRGWLMIGGPEASRGLPPDATAGTIRYGGQLPDAAEHEPGHWILWSPQMGLAPFCLVCVEIPL